jgi:hypothetical protein
MSVVIDVQDSPDAPATRTRLMTPGKLTVLVLALMFSVGAVLASPLLGVSNGSDPLDVRYGLPIPWVHQDQSSLTPPHPSQTGFVAPWDYPTTFSAVVFIVDVVLVFVAALAVLALLAVAFRELKRSRRA